MCNYNNAMDFLRRISIIFLVFASQVAYHRAQSCSFDLDQCIESIKLILDNSNGFFAFDKEELDNVCRTLPKSLKCVNDYVNACFSEKQKRTVNETMNLSLELFNELCKEGPYQKEYLLHAPCFKDKCQETHRRVLNTTFSNDATETQDEAIQRFCCAYNDYLQCATRETLADCGEETSRFVENYLRRAVKPMVQGCSKYSESSQGCTASIPSTGFLTSIVALLGVFLSRAVLNKIH